MLVEYEQFLQESFSKVQSLTNICIFAHTFRTIQTIALQIWNHTSRNQTLIISEFQHVSKIITKLKIEFMNSLLNLESVVRPVSVSFSLPTCTHYIHHILPVESFGAQALQKQTESKRTGTAYGGNDY